MTAPRTSPFVVRGVIEGFYGRPWTHEQRLDLIPFLADHGMNTFAYGPKDDPLLRHEWREPYSGPELERLNELVGACREVHVDFMFCLSPGLSMRYSSEGDRRALVAKYASIGTLGVTSFGLLLDDIPDDPPAPGRPGGIRRSDRGADRPRGVRLWQPPTERAAHRLPDPVLRLRRRACRRATRPAHGPAHRHVLDRAPDRLADASI